MADTKGMFSKYLAEFIGTYTLMCTIGFAVLVGLPNTVAFAISAALMVLVYTFGGVSGGHFNPAVSFGVAVSGNMSYMECLYYSLCQLGGAFGGAATVRWITADIFNLQPQTAFNGWSACTVECLFTAFLVFTVLNCCYNKASQGNEYYGMAIGFTLAVGIYASAYISGGCLNPAVAIAADAISPANVFGWGLAYAASQLAGGVLAVLGFRLCRPEEFGGQPGTMTSKLIAEFIGTFFLCLTVACNVLINAKENGAYTALSVGSALMCGIYCIGNVSGAHFNPAVTVSVLLSGRNKLDAFGASCYVLAQILASLAASVVGGLVTKAMPNRFFLGPVVKTMGVVDDVVIKVNFDWWCILFVECFFTLILCYAVLAVATTTKPLKEFYGVAIGFVIVMAGYTAGNVSGGIFNPAVGISLALNNAMFHHGSFWKCLPYAGFEIGGGILAAGLFTIIHAREYIKEKTVESNV